MAFDLHHIVAKISLVVSTWIYFGSFALVSKLLKS